MKYSASLYRPFPNNQCRGWEFAQRCFWPGSSKSSNLGIFRAEYRHFFANWRLIFFESASQCSANELYEWFPPRLFGPAFRAIRPWYPCLKHSLRPPNTQFWWGCPWNQYPRRFSAVWSVHRLSVRNCPYTWRGGFSSIGRARWECQGFIVKTRSICFCRWSLACTFQGHF